ncbi:Tripartite tricarboxylate transporter TctB family protein [Halomonas sp. THAF12]|uniref:tripartite tricarboxylate transporter TctB family protein n=1 Tax=Halomonas sp. THAF12 TaxID=2587849 RepID=UPI0012688AD7|nr:tripartite tricarboxylate transporter TctB family protein [Halomonas sp. THAF12]QFT85247.1 Tripartite tricarboxylate transporter TctB family protein [Halomonas sp. THAF12]
MTFNDRIFGVLLIALAVAYGWGATQFPEPFGGAEAVGPKTFPHLLAVVLSLSSLYLIVRPDPDNAWPWSRTGAELLIAVAVLIVYTALLQPLGFILSTLLALGTLCWRMGAPPVRAYVTGGVAGVVVFLIFNFALDLALPLGPLSVLEVN